MPAAFGTWAFALQQFGTLTLRDVLEPTLQPAEYEGFAGVRNFHIACDLMTIAVLWAKEWRRRKTDQPPVVGAT